MENVEKVIQSLGIQANLLSDSDKVKFLHTLSHLKSVKASEHQNRLYEAHIKSMHKYGVIKNIFVFIGLVLPLVGGGLIINEIKDKDVQILRNEINALKDEIKEFKIANQKYLLEIMHKK